MLRDMTAAPLLELVRDPVQAPVTRPIGRANLRRPRLIERLAGPGALPLAVLVAPAGFGKTRLLREWANRDPRPFAWVTLQARHDDPATLLRSVSLAVDSACAEALDGRAVLVLDNVHVLRHAPARETIAAIVDQLPASISVALASRAEPPIPLARLRADALVTELRHGDLAMTRSEAASLLRGAGLKVGRDEVDALVRTTEGWPAALSLAALSLADQPVSGAVVARLGGGDRLVAEYLRDEVLADLEPDQRQFVRHTAILDVLTAPLCDALLERSGSDEMLAQLVRAGFPLVALDRNAERFRHHRLLSDLLRADLSRGDRELEARLHRRASAWHVQAGDAERGLQHALAADEVERAGDLVWNGLPRSIEQGSSATVEHWLSRFTDAQVGGHPRLALAAAGTQLVHGQGDLAEHWLAAAAASAADPEIAGGVAALRAALGRDGLALMTRDAEHASALLGPDSPCQALCELLRGVADHLRGDVDVARQRLEAGARRAAVPAPHVHALCLTQLALIALEDDDAEGAVRLITRARSQVARYALSRYPTTALVLAVTAFVRAQRGRVEDAHADATEAASLLERLVDLAPWYEAEVRLVLVRTALRLSDVNGARTQLAAARRIVAREPEAVLLARWLDQADADVGAFVGSAPRLPSSLTGAELRILQYLPTHLSFREIADRTFVSANTVKTQANAVYRKLDVRSRSEAVTLARELGLLDG
jgi:LuxR family maltose regulon positive regulatory protein